MLNTLATQNSELEPTRRSRSQAKLANVVRKLSHEVYTAFQNVLTCSCAHSLGLGMAGVPRKDVILPGDDAQDVERAIPLDIILESGGKTQKWNRLRVQQAEDKVRSPTPPDVHSPISLPRSKSPRKVHWSSSWTNRTPSSTSCVTQTVTQTQHSSYLSASIHLSSGTVPPPITDLCHTIQKGQYNTTAATDCFGNISCNSRTFNLYHQDCQVDHVTLSTVLDDPGHGGLVTFNYIERLKLALSLSYSVLHLHKTPWLANTVGPEDITFLGDSQQALQNAACCPGRPYLARPMPSTTPGAGQMHPTQAEGRPMDLTILSLGLLLIQIMIGRRISDLALEPDMRMKSTLSKKELASKYIASVTESGGMNYAGAVQWCLGSILSVACLDDEKFSQDFYNAVIVRLEGDLGTQSLMTVSGSEK